MAQIDIRISIDDRMVRWDDPEFAELLPISSEMLRTLDGQRDGDIAGAINAISKAVLALENQQRTGLTVTFAR